jgi:hypothetical protein
MRLLFSILLPAAFILACAVTNASAQSDPGGPQPSTQAQQQAPELTDARKNREALWNEIRPVALKNCTFRRFGSAYDGGYLMCENLISGIESAYSYGIAGEDNWGCEVSQKLFVGVHQYDCFTPDRPSCPNGRFVFHSECVGPNAAMIDSHPFDTLADQIAKNGDTGKRLLLKMDVEGAEWESFMATPNKVLEQIDQLPMELHGVDQQRFVEVIRKLKQTFYLVSVHFNNWACSKDIDPFPSWAYQVLFVNKRIGVLDPDGPVREPGSPPDARDNPSSPDCQPKDFLTTK